MKVVMLSDLRTGCLYSCRRYTCYLKLLVLLPISTAAVEFVAICTYEVHFGSCSKIHSNFLNYRYVSLFKFECYLLFQTSVAVYSNVTVLVSNPLKLQRETLAVPVSSSDLLISSFSCTDLKYRDQQGTLRDLNFTENLARELEKFFKRVWYTLSVKYDTSLPTEAKVSFDCFIKRSYFLGYGVSSTVIITRA